MSKLERGLDSTRQLMAFLAVGVIGFMVDVGLFFIYLRGFGIDVIVARALAFLPATMVTWWANRLFTFPLSTDPRESRMREYLKYLLVQAGGIAVNFTVFYLIILWLPIASAHAILPLAVGALTALAFNFLGARLLVFRR
jgi:putative flippase GtrA